MQAMCERKLVVPFSSWTHSASHRAHYVIDCYALVVSIFCDENERITFHAAQDSENWMAPMHLKYDAIVKKGTC